MSESRFAATTKRTASSPDPQTHRRTLTDDAFREIARPARLVYTEVFDDPWYPGEALDTAVLTEERGKTILTTTVVCASQEIRDGVLKSGMETGVARSYDRLEEILESSSTRKAETVYDGQGA